MTPETALHDLELAFRRWYYATGQAAPDIGILVIALRESGCDLQYMGIDPKAVVDWAALFAGILQQIESGAYRVDSTAEVIFPSQR